MGQDKGRATVGCTRRGKEEKGRGCEEKMARRGGRETGK